MCLDLDLIFPISDVAVRRLISGTCGSDWVAVFRRPAKRVWPPVLDKPALVCDWRLTLATRLIAHNRTMNQPEGLR